LSDSEVADVRRRVQRGETKAFVAREYGISRETLYQYLRAAN
jgi:DNA-binding phage protein